MAATTIVLTLLPALSGCRRRDTSSIDADITFSLSPRGNALVFDGEGTGERDLYFLDLERNRVTRIASTPDYEFEPDLSPDEGLVAFVGRSPGHPQEHIFVQKLDGGNRKQLTAEFSSDRSPGFSPDGSRIVFTRSRTYNWGGLHRPGTPEIRS